MNLAGEFSGGSDSYMLTFAMSCRYEIIIMGYIRKSRIHVHKSKIKLSNVSWINNH